MDFSFPHLSLFVRNATYDIDLTVLNFFRQASSLNNVAMSCGTDGTPHDVMVLLCN